MEIEHNRNDATRLVIIGAGGHGRGVADAAMLNPSWKHIEFRDDFVGAVSKPRMPSITGSISSYKAMPPEEATQFIVALGDNKIRLSFTQSLIELGHTAATIVHPSATISPFCKIQVGSAVLAGAIINIGATVGVANIINSNCTIEHDCVLADGVHVSPGAQLAGGCQIGQCSWVGAGSCIVNQAHIGDHSIIGAGSVVIKSLASRGTFVGNPAREV